MMKRVKRREAVAFLAVLICGMAAVSPVQAAKPYTSYIVPRIKDSSNRPVPSAYVAVYSQCWDRVASGYTNSRGVTKFTKLPAGTYYVYSSKHGVGSGWATTTLARGQGPGRPVVKLR